MCASRIVRIVALVYVGCVTPAVAFAQVPTADDFLPVVQGGPSDVKCLRKNNLNKFYFRGESV